MLLSPPRPAVPLLDQRVRLNRASLQAQGLLGHWTPLLYRGGNQIGDLCGLHPATFQSAPTWQQDPVVGMFATYTSPTYATIVDSQRRFATPYLTVSGWFRPTTSASFGSLLQRRTAGNSLGWTFQIAGSAGVMSFFTSAGSVQSISGWTAGVWWHFACTYDGVTHRQYRNGVEVGSHADAGTIADPGATSLISIGRNEGGTTNFIDADVGPLSIYDHALSPAEIWQQWAPQTRWDLYAPVRQRLYAPPAATLDDIIPLYQRVGMGPASYGLRV